MDYGIVATELASVEGRWRRVGRHRPDDVRVYAYSIELNRIVVCMMPGSCCAALDRLFAGCAA